MANYGKECSAKVDNSEPPAGMFRPDKRVSDETLASICGMARGNLKTSRAEVNIVEKLALDEEASRATIARLEAQQSRDAFDLDNLCGLRAQLAAAEAQLAEALDCNCSQKHALRSLRAQIAEPAEVTDEMVEAVWQALKGLEGILISQNIWGIHKDEFCRRIAQAVLDAPATGTNDSAASLGYLAAQALLEKVETHDQP